MTGFKEAANMLGCPVIVNNERHFGGKVRMLLSACILRRKQDGETLYCQAEVRDKSGTVYIVNLRDIDGFEEVEASDV